jgi:DHA1 family tetracycline resistance protein-like MFS transporter
VILKLLPILGITFIDILGFSILIPLMPYFVKHFGASDVVVGALFGVFAFCQFIAGPLWGNVSDRLGRKRVLSVTQAYVSDLIEPDKRARAFGYVGAAFSAGLIFGPASGGYLVQHYGFTTPFLLAAGLQAVTLLLTILVLPESRTHSADDVPASLRDIPRAFTIRGVAPVMWQKLIFALGIYGWFGAFTLVLQKQFGFNATGTSYFFCAFGGVSVIAQLAAVGRISERAGDRRASTIGYVLLMGAFAIVPFATAIWQAAAMIVCFSLGLALVNASLPAQLSRLAPEAMRGTVLGAASSMESIAGIFMPLATTYALQVGGVLPAAAIPFVFTGFALVLGVQQVLRAPALLPATPEAR